VLVQFLHEVVAVDGVVMADLWEISHGHPGWVGGGVIIHVGRVVVWVGGIVIHGVGVVVWVVRVASGGVHHLLVPHPVSNGPGVLVVEGGHVVLVEHDAWVDVLVEESGVDEISLEGRNGPEL